MLRYKIMILIFVEMITAPATKPPKYYPNLPMGEYKIRLKASDQCEHFENNKLQLNFIVSRTGLSTYVLKGNLTFLIPFDDSLTITYSFAKKGSIGGWAENYYVWIVPKACSSWKSLAGNIWHSLSEVLHNQDCPIREGVYILSGFDLEKFQNNNFPKVFFYGEYRLKVIVTSSNTGKKVGCVIHFIDLVRPWEY